MIEENTKEKNMRAILVGVEYQNISREECEKSIEELSALLDTAGGETFATMIQGKESPDPKTYIGSGKLKELADMCEKNGIELVVFDVELSPSQIKNIEDGLKNVRVIDRTMLILDIFAKHAVTGEGKLQVELAQLKYTAPRLMGKGNELSRLGGGIGTRGPGESKLESDRRHLKRREEALEAELASLDKNRAVMRAARNKSGITKVAIVGYTNAGKSTLLNRMTNAGILAEDKLFATLDPTTRKFELSSGESILLTDTVGFIKKLPHQLVKAFKSTLDEAVYADILMIIIDASDKECAEQLKVTEDLLAELGAAGKPTIYVFNKCDKESENISEVRANIQKENIVYISAKTGEGMETLEEKLEELVMMGKKRVKFVIPNAKSGLLNMLYKNAVVESVEYGDTDITVEAIADAKTVGALGEYIYNSQL